MYNLSTLSIILCVQYLNQVMAINSLHQLNHHLDKNTTVQIGFLSEGNFHSVQNELHSNAIPQYYDSNQELYDGVLNNEIIAGLVSGTVGPNDDLNQFGSDQINTHAFMFSRSNPLVDAFDNAIIQMIEEGTTERLAEENFPFKNLVVHTCMSSTVDNTWDNITPNTTVRIGSLGPYNWGTYDGDYTQTPYTGFWPQYYNSIETIFQQHRNITFERIWYPTSNSLLNALETGDIDTTEPYMIVGSAYQGKSRKTTFDYSCITSGSQNSYFVKKEENDTPSSSDDTSPFIGVIIGISIIAMGALIAVVVLYRNEKKGTPIFTPLMSNPKTEINMSERHTNNV